MHIRNFLIVLIVSLPLSGFAGNETARVVTYVGKPVECIAPIEVYNIDGKLVKKNAMGFNIDPGTHTLVGLASIDGLNCPAMRGTARDIPALEYDFQAGYTYFIGLNHKSPSQQEWFFTVWRVIEPKAGD